MAETFDASTPASCCSIAQAAATSATVCATGSAPVMRRRAPAAPGIAAPPCDSRSGASATKPACASCTARSRVALFRPRSSCTTITAGLLAGAGCGLATNAAIVAPPEAYVISRASGAGPLCPAGTVASAATHRVTATRLRDVMRSVRAAAARLRLERPELVLRPDLDHGRLAAAVVRHDDPRLAV